MFKVKPALSALCAVMALAAPSAGIGQVVAREGHAGGDQSQEPWTLLIAKVHSAATLPLLSRSTCIQAARNLRGSGKLIRRDNLFCIEQATGNLITIDEQPSGRLIITDENGNMEEVN